MAEPKKKHTEADADAALDRIEEIIEKGGKADPKPTVEEMTATLAMLNMPRQEPRQHHRRPLVNRPGAIRSPGDAGHPRGSFQSHRFSR